MKKLLFLFSYVFTCSVFGQECRINNDPVSPLKNLACKSSVGYKDDIQFYSFPDSLNHLLISISVEDHYRRISYQGDSATILLKNNHKIKLTNVRTFIPQHKVQNLIFVDQDIYTFTFMAWISKRDVNEISMNLVDKMRFYIHIEEDSSSILKDKNRQKYQTFTEVSDLIWVWNRKAKRVAKCALNL